MIGYLIGTPKITATTTLIVTNGVGYSVELTPTARQYAAGKERVELFIYPHIKEDCFDLYGFLTESEKALFLLLIGVNGVGPKSALHIMDRGDQAIIAAIQHADVDFFSSIPRVGKKTAQKIIIELKSKLKGREELDLSTPSEAENSIIEALVSLGFGEQASSKIAKRSELQDMRLEDAVKRAIQLLTTEEKV